MKRNPWNMMMVLILACLSMVVVAGCMVNSNTMFGGPSSDAIKAAAAAGMKSLTTINNVYVGGDWTVNTSQAKPIDTSAANNNNLAYSAAGAGVGAGVGGVPGALVGAGAGLAASKVEDAINAKDTAPPAAAGGQ